jgi:hypothetical protein
MKTIIKTTEGAIFNGREENLGGAVDEEGSSERRDIVDSADSG